MSPSRRALVLNATFEPLGIVSSRRAVLLVLDTKAELVHTTERVFRAERLTVPEPSVVRLVRYVQVPRHYRVAVNRRTVFARDGSRCQYCGSAAENLDHVIPRSKGGPHTWENVVAACRRCNTRKEDRLPHEAGMVLRSTPVAPRHRVQLLALCGGGSEDWNTYLGRAWSGPRPSCTGLTGRRSTASRLCRRRDGSMAGVAGGNGGSRSGRERRRAPCTRRGRGPPHPDCGSWPCAR